MMMDAVRLYTAIFFIYAIAGWVMESVMFSVKNKKPMNRGFLVGPVCPIYGYGVVLISVLLKKYQHDLFATFCMSVILCGLLEYFTSYFMEKMFHARWWDYSRKKYNINGRICLENLVLFGIAACVILFIVNPFLIREIRKIPEILLNITLSVMCAMYIADNIISFKIVFNLKQVSNEVKDNTAEISEKVRKIIHSKSVLHRRMVNSFPHIKENVAFKKWTIKEFGKKIQPKKEN